jgi:hypothetical protein
MLTIAWHRSPRKPAATRDREPTRRADAQPNPVRSASSSSRLPIPLSGPRARKRARTPARCTRSGRGHRAGGVTPAEQSCPAVKTSRPCLPPRGAEHAVGGIRTWGENPGRRASPPMTVLPFGAFACADRKVVLGLLRIVGLTPGEYQKRFTVSDPQRAAGSRRESYARASARCSISFGLRKPDPEAQRVHGQARPCPS